MAVIFLYQAFKRFVGIFFNVLNVLMAGNLPPFGCVCIIVEDQGRYVAIKRPDGRFVFPGGFIRWGEQPAQTAQRECKEETGLDIRLREATGYQAHVGRHIDQMSTINIVFSAEAVGGELHHSIEGQPYWLQADEIRDKLIPFYQHIYDDYLHYLNRHGQASTDQS